MEYIEVRISAIHDQQIVEMLVALLANQDFEGFVEDDTSLSAYIIKNQFDESAYESALAYDLRELGFEIQQQYPMPFVYKEVKQDVGYRIDIVVNNKVIIEIKSIETLAPVHFAQTLTYLRLSGLKLALLMNFNSKILKGNIHRIVNNL